MNKTLCFLLVFAPGIFISQSYKKNETVSNEPVDLIQFVDPLIGTAHCRWFHVAPGASPFGMAKHGPSTNGPLGNISGWEAVG
jgi:hypothetical protein